MRKENILILQLKLVIKILQIKYLNINLLKSEILDRINKNCDQGS